MRAFIAILACSGIVAALNCPRPAKLTAGISTKGRYVVEVEVKSKETNGDKFVFKVELKDRIRAPFVGSLWGTTDLYTPDKVTIPKSCTPALQALRVGQTYIAIGEGDDYLLVRNSRKLDEKEKEFLKKLRQ
ncbi:hypothetical protein ANCCAN_22678 [Ancylostoma caninum]|uniref:Netrin module non-TIMP type domain-containing protein n=1 Tax=Ancylostoma caninum TaxID=29170 RepID=A0A368FH15_ANCCA|nr:hypothetical protein ANCCAN_22678 [Ancylostoma caninum]